MAFAEIFHVSEIGRRTTKEESASHGSDAPETAENEEAVRVILEIILKLEYA